VHYTAPYLDRMFGSMLLLSLQEWGLELYSRQGMKGKTISQQVGECMNHDKSIEILDNTEN